MAQDQQKLNIIYIASTGRSGSTLLDMILGTHSQIATSGEIQVWPHEIIKGGFQSCGCGQQIPDCPFWTTMRQKVEPLQQPEPQIHFFRERHNAGKTLNWQRLNEFYQKKIHLETPAKIKNYGKNNYQVYKAFIDLTHEITGVRPQWIVDASKDPYRLLWLVRSAFFNIKVLHIIKDPRAFVYSMTKIFGNNSPKRNHGKLIRYTVTKSLSWVIQNHLISQIARNYLPIENYLLVPYEKLSSQPKNTLKETFRMIGCDFEEQVLTNFRDNTIHTVAGNRRTRSQKQGIELDEAWKHLMPNFSRRLTEIITQVNKSFYGY